MREEATLTGFKTSSNIAQTRVISAETCWKQRVNGTCRKLAVCTNRPELRTSSVRNCPKTFHARSETLAMLLKCSVEQLRLHTTKNAGERFVGQCMERSYGSERFNGLLSFCFLRRRSCE